MPVQESAADWVETIRGLTRASSPRQVLCVGDAAGPLLADCGLKLCEAQPRELLRRDYDSVRFDLALIVGVLDELPRPEGFALLARVRDLLARRLLLQLVVHENSDDGWTRRDVLGMGLEEVMRSGGNGIGVFQFNLYDYKLTPDWLNAENWAHPHQWKP